MFARLDIFKIVLLAAFMFGLSACAPLIAVPPAADQDAPLTLNNNDAMLLMPGDSVKISVYGDDTLSGTYAIDARGRITMPMVGAIEANGLSQQGLQEKIAQTLKKRKFMDDPLVSADLLTTRPYYIMGEVKTPGSYPYQPALNSFQAIASAGGYTPRAARNRILIDRKQGDKTIRLNASENTPILPGDSITIRERIL